MKPMPYLFFSRRSKVALCAVVIAAALSTFWVATSLHADEQRASLRLPPVSAATGVDDASLHRRMTRLRKLVRQERKHERDGAPESGEVFARTREEAKQKIIAELTQEGEEAGAGQQSAVASIGFCEAALRSEEKTAVAEILKPLDRRVPELRVDWADSTDQQASHSALQKALGRPRYLEVARQCETIRKSDVQREIDMAVRIVSADLGLPAAKSRKISELVQKRNKELDTLFPEGVARLDDHGKLVGTPEQAVDSMGMYAERYAETEDAYARQFQQILGPALWKRYSDDVLTSSETYASPLEWIQWTLFRAPSEENQESVALKLQGQSKKATSEIAQAPRGRMKIR